MVDDTETVNQVVEIDNGSPGWALPLLLFGGFRSLIDQLHAELAAHGHPDIRPAHGFAMQAIGQDGTTATALGRRLGISKQAAGKTVGRLVELGYAQQVADASDARRKLVRLTPRGFEVLARSAAVFEELRAQWVAELGAERTRELEADLRRMAPAEGFRLDASGWFGT